MSNAEPTGYERIDEEGTIESGSLSTAALEGIVAAQTEKIRALETVVFGLRHSKNAHTSDVARGAEQIKILHEQVKSLQKHIAAMIVNNPQKPSYTVSQNQSCDGLMWNKDHPKKFYISPTGGHKDIADKPRLDLVPIEFVEGAALAFKFGAKKYSAHNWRKGIEVSILVRSLLSHVMKYNDGEDKDHESNLHHLDHACATLAMLITTAKTMPHMDNRYGKALRTPLGEFIRRQEAAGNAINTNYRESSDNSEGRV